ncbi:MAG: NAD(P)/FAD-dependent oxidoreductase [Flavobacteriales bacterium]
MSKKFAIVGGGAAGFFAAINHAALFPENQVAILEKGNQFLAKVKISGGGRCNVTHACFDPQELIHFYPRGSQELLGPFHHFNCSDTAEWFQSHGVELKTEEDGRMFPVTDSSQTIIDCLVNEATTNRVELCLQTGVLEIEKKENTWNLITSAGPREFDKLVIATGGSPLVWEMLKMKGHTIIDPVPSLFTFIIKHPVISGLPGISLTHATIRIKNTSVEAEGPLLITHVGLSGPAVLKLSAFGAFEFNKVDYKAILELDFSGNGKEYVAGVIKETKEAWGSKKIKNTALFNIPHRLWQSVLDYSEIAEKNWADLSRKNIESLINNIACLELTTSGKNTFKEEFVTAGGISLAEVNMKTMESKLLPGLFFAGEVLNIDAVTGGFNFQAAWTTGFLASGGLKGN